MNDLDPFAKRGDAVPYASFPEIGDEVSGVIEHVEYKHDTDPATGDIKKFSDGTPRPVVVVYLRTENGELIRDFVKGRSVSDFRTRVWTAEGDGERPKPGAHYKRTFISMNGREKVYKIEYRPGEKRELV